MNRKEFYRIFSGSSVCIKVGKKRKVGQKPRKSSVVIKAFFVHRPLKFRKIVQPVLVCLKTQECLVAALVQYALENVPEFCLRVDCGS